MYIFETEDLYKNQKIQKLFAYKKISIMYHCYQHFWRKKSAIELTELHSNEPVYKFVSDVNKNLKKN